MDTSSNSTSHPSPPGGGLADCLVELAGTPDDASSLPALLRSITQFAADVLPPISYASMTAHADDSYVTVAMTSEVALAVGEAQYADRAGPCLDALTTAEPVAMPRIDATMRCPRFRVAAHDTDSAYTILRSHAATASSLPGAARNVITGAGEQQRPS